MKVQTPKLTHARRELIGWLFVMPMLVFFAVFVVYPIIDSVRTSFMGFDFTKYYWTGFDNYKQIFKDELFWKSIRNTLAFVFYLVPSITVLSLLLSLLINTYSKKMQAFFKAVFFIPSVTSIVSITLVWGYILNNQFGIGNYLLKLLGAEPANWLGIHLAYPTLSLIIFTLGIGNAIIVFTAALNGIPMDLYESASLDGAKRSTLFFKITLPLLKPSLLYIIVTSTIASFQVFSIILLMTAGGPAFHTTTILVLIYQQAFVTMNFGVANAMGVILCIIICCIAYIQFKLFRSDIEY
ncbi:sugar ABC transporter permease [Paenibacillus psychroresistens]|uniref:Sugar ABC transporter permease n=1 Tax=Paenibacillus psychroresistens TaxID=1778678 RepID=A0A6B8RJ46_9BACL|nr:sugar ABC transporter permease [Paenibacillus psychroresistens]QGQ95573.1 sugar ABC transporter permease [Paenibacillus psychroresistens]